MSDVSVIIPFAGNDEHRARARDWIVSSYALNAWDYEVVTPVSIESDDDWCKATAVDELVSHATGEILVISDADVWAEELRPAIAAVEAGACWAIPHTKVHRLDEVSAGNLIRSKSLEFVEGAPLARAPYIGVAGGGIVVLNRSDYENVPLDHRFVGWGGEDHSWGYALTTLLGLPTRCGGRLWHLWHPPQPHDAVQRKANDKLRARYKKAQRSPAQMRALVDAGRPQCRSNRS